MQFLMSPMTDRAKEFLTCPFWTAFRTTFWAQLGGTVQHNTDNTELVTVPDPKDWTDAQILFGHVNALCQRVGLELKSHPGCVSALPVDKKFMPSGNPFMDLPIGQHYRN